MVQLVPCFSCKGFFPPGHAACPNCGAKRARVLVPRRSPTGALAAAGTALFTFVACNCYGNFSVACPDGGRACFIPVLVDAGTDGGDAGPGLEDGGRDGGDAGIVDGGDSG
jgi:hypothetical protein